MLDIIKKELNVSIISSIIYIILGIIIILYPLTALTTVSIIIAVLSMIYGVIIAAINISNLKNGGSPIFGIILIFIGVALLMYPRSLNILISLVVGFWFISSSINRIKLAIMVKGNKEVNWIVILLLGIITLLIGISFVFTPLASAVTLAVVSGILMIAYSICDIIEIVFIKKNIKTIQKEFKKN